MKKIAVLLIVCLFAVNFVNAQKREVTRAKRQLSRGNLEVALTHINNALNDPTTMEEADTWVVKTRVLLEIARSETPETQNLVEKPLDAALKTIKKAQELDVTNINILEINQSLLILSELFFNQGAIAYNDEEYPMASQSFLNAYNVGMLFGTADTSTLYNAALSAEIGEMYDEAYELYVQVEEMKYDQPFLYNSLTNISLRNKEYDLATKWIKIGRDKYPDNLDLIFAEANVYLISGNIPEARRVLEIAIERDPENANLHYAFAVNYDQMSKDSLYTEEERSFAYEEAIKAYKKAIELKPDYFDANYNLGALYFNEGIQKFVEADNILRSGYTNENLRKSSELEERSKEIWREDAQPFLERAYELLSEDDPSYEVVLRSLRELYMRTGQAEKLEETNEIWNTRFANPDEN
jgi:tetratricopeptide (TPR) repeat protein